MTLVRGLSTADSVPDGADSILSSWATNSLKGYLSATSLYPTHTMQIKFALFPLHM